VTLKARASFVAENCEYDVSGARRKRLGTVRYNSTALLADLGGGAVTLTFTALADFWRHGTCLDGVQRFVAHAGTTLYKDDGDGTWDAIDSTLAWGTNGSLTTITIAQGFAVFANGVDVPKKWDQTTLSDLSSGAPYFSQSTYHLRRLWVSGFASNPSQLWYTKAGDITDFTGSDTGTILFDEDDGDRITGMSQPWQNRLYIFKGPNNGSVWNVSGNTVNTFTRTRMFSAAPCVSHRSVITTPDDIFWASRHGFHSLSATNKFGDTEQFFLSRPIQASFRALSDKSLSQIIGFSHPTRNVIGWFCSEGGRNDVAFVYNYVTKAWAIWRFTGIGAASCMVAITPGTRESRLYLGGYNGYVYAADQPIRADENGDQAYTYRVRTPIHQRFSESLTELHEKTFFSVTSFFSPVATPSTMTVTAWVDNFTTATTLTGTKNVTLSLSGDLWDVSWIWDQSLWDGRGGGAYDEFIIEGRGRSIQIDWMQNTVGGDVELLGYAVRVAPGEPHAFE